MASDYPAAVDTFTANGANLSTAPHSALHTDLNDSVIATQTELGTAPSGTFSTVKARLDSITPVGQALTNWTPVLQQGAGVTVTVTYARFQRVGRKVDCWFNLAITGTGTAANPVIVGDLPATAAVSELIVGYGQLFDTSANAKYGAGIYTVSTTTVDFRSVLSAANDNRLGVTSFTAALDAGDVLKGHFTYEAATD